MLLVQDANEVVLDLLFIFFEFLLHLGLEVLLLFFEFFDALIEHLDMQLELLLHLDVVPHFGFVLLELLLIFLGRKVN